MTNAEDFTVFLRNELINACARGRYGLMAHLIGPPIRFDSDRMRLLRNWITSMSEEQREMVKLLMDQCADSCLFRFAATIDGVSGLNEETYLQLHLISGGQATEIARGNTPGGSEWHNIVSMLVKKVGMEE